MICTRALDAKMTTTAADALTAYSYCQTVPELNQIITEFNRSMVVREIHIFRWLIMWENSEILYR
jgi:hypothetical protein